MHHVNRGHADECSKPPFALPRIKLNLSWHPRTHLDLVHTWVRSALMEAASGLSGPAGDVLIGP